MTSLKIMKKKLSRKLRIAKKQVKKLTIRMKKLQRKKTKTKKKRRRRKRTRSRTKVQKGGLFGALSPLQKKWKGCLPKGSPNGCDWMGKFAFKDAMQKEIKGTTDTAAFEAYAQLVKECVMNANAKNSDGKTNCRPQAKIGVYAPNAIGSAPGSPW